MPKGIRDLPRHRAKGVAISQVLSFAELQVVKREEVAGREVVARQEKGFPGLWAYGLGTGAMLMACRVYGHRIRNLIERTSTAPTSRANGRGRYRISVLR